MSKLLLLILLTLTTVAIAESETASASPISQATADDICKRLGGKWTPHPGCAGCKTCTVCIKSAVVTRCHYIACNNTGCDYVVARQGGGFGRPWRYTAPTGRR
jgi:hypothetical protein